MNEFRDLLVPAILGSILGGSVFRLLFREASRGGAIGVLIGMVAGGFLGSFAGMMLALAYPKASEWPLNYWVSTLSATCFTVGFLKFTRDSIEE